MFHDIPQNIIDRMKYLEQMDAADRLDGTTRMQRFYYGVVLLMNS